MPDDGHRYEIIDGSLVVTPAPSLRHQLDTAVQPDLLIARRTDLTDRDLPAAPVLAVEILSPSTRRIDLTLKRSRYEAAGCPAYWVVDPDGPSITTWNLRNGVYVESAHASGDQELEVGKPYPLTIIAARLLD